MTCKPASFRAMLSWEARRIWRGVTPWLFVAAVPVLFVLTGNWQAPGLERYKEMLLYLLLLNTALSAYAAWSIQRDRRAGTDEVMLAWPVSSRQLYLAHTLALGSLTAVLWLEAALPSLAYTAVSYTTAARAAGVATPLADALRDGGLIVLSLSATFLGAQATGQLAAALLPDLAGLVALVLYRSFTFAGARFVLSILQWPYALLASAEFQSDIWPWLVQHLHVGLFEDVFVAHQAFWVLGSLGVLVALACLFQARRDTPRRRSRLLAAGGLFVALAAALPFIALEHGYAASHARAVATYGEAIKPGLRRAKAPEVAVPESTAALPEPLRYELALDLTQPPEASVEATLEMAAGPQVPHDSLALTLRRAFEVNEVRLDGSAVPFAREGDLLRLRPAQPLPADRPFAVSLRYHGTVADWRLDPYETPAALAAREFIWLPSTWGWYPVPGAQRLTWEIGMTSMVARALADRTTPFNDAEPAFDVSVRAPAGVRTLIGFAQDGEGTWRLQQSRNQVTLLGGDWWLRGDGAARFAVPFEELDTWQAGTADVQRLFDALAGWTGIAPLTVAPSPLRFTNAGDFTLIMNTSFAGDAFQAAPSQQLLAAVAAGRVWDLLRPQLVSAAVADPAHSALQDDLQALRAYVTDRVVEDAFGAVPGVAEKTSDPSLSAMPRVEAWAARTPREVQKAALRRLFHDALLRPLAQVDLAFLGEGEP